MSKGFGHMKSDWSNKEDEKKKKKDQGNKILKATMESDEEKSLDELLHEFFFTPNDGEEEIEDDLRSIFEELYQDPIKIAKHNKELKKMVEASNSKKEELKNKVTMLEQKHKEKTSTNEGLHIKW